MDLKATRFTAAGARLEDGLAPAALSRGAAGLAASQPDTVSRPDGGHNLRQSPANKEVGQPMKVKAAVLHDIKTPFEITELDLDGPGAGEVLIRYVAAGLCHSDLHLTDGDLPPRFPIVGGHEGAGIIEEIGPGVTKVKPGDHVVCSFIPNCGVCRYCATGHSSLCDLGANILVGSFPDGSFRFHSGGADYGQMCMLGTFAEYATISEHSVVKVDPALPLATAVLVGCGVPTAGAARSTPATSGPGTPW